MERLVGMIQMMKFILNDLICKEKPVLHKFLEARENIKVNEIPSHQ